MQLSDLKEDIDYLAQTMLREHGILPDQFYQCSFSDWMRMQNAKSKKDRLVDPLELARQVGAL